jgi:hypothetical protein
MIEKFKTEIEVHALEGDEVEVLNYRIKLRPTWEAGVVIGVSIHLDKKGKPTPEYRLRLKRQCTFGEDRYRPRGIVLTCGNEGIR